ncbi:hypothetical protein RhiirA4_473358 [Rhizophagus irregularis]|uniref:F-box domain-containing protein n=1 Tax=Rhizophagus irregularis TaxID=588596 RepID=A0A2I1H6L3_9GLOM|nr:hypothetical protein RhiirA4_473358 [Rhizophagus irregularis]
MSQLPADCLNEIIEYLKDDKITLCSCLLVNRLWCETSVRTFWRDSGNYNIRHYRTLIACLPNESKKIIYDKGIVISSPTLKLPIFKYETFCKILSISRVYKKIGELLEETRPIIFNPGIVDYIQIVVLNLLRLLFKCEQDYVDFDKLSYASFSQLQILKIRNICSKCKSLIKFLEINGKSLKEFYLSEDHVRCHNDNSLNLAIANFCPNIRKLFVGFKHDNELESLKVVLNSCQYLETIKIWCTGSSLSEKEALEAVVKYSQNIHEIILYHTSDVISKLLPEELEAFFVNKYDKNMEIINEYIKLGVIKNFKIAEFDNGGFIF